MHLPRVNRHWFLDLPLLFTGTGTRVGSAFLRSAGSGWCGDLVGRPTARLTGLGGGTAASSAFLFIDLRTRASSVFFRDAGAGTVPFFLVDVATGTVPFFCWDVGTRPVPFFFFVTGTGAGSAVFWATGTGAGSVFSCAIGTRAGSASPSTGARTGEGDGRQPRRRLGRSPDGVGPAAEGWVTRTCAAPILGPVAEVRDRQAQPEAEDEGHQAELRRPPAIGRRRARRHDVDEGDEGLLRSLQGALPVVQLLPHQRLGLAARPRLASSGDVLWPTM